MKPYLFTTLFFIVIACGKKSSNPPFTPLPLNFDQLGWTVGDKSNQIENDGVATDLSIRIGFQSPLERTSVTTAIELKDVSGIAIAYTVSYEKGDSVVVIKPASSLQALTRYTVTAKPSLKSKDGGQLRNTLTINFLTQINTSPKFPSVTDSELLDIVQKQTFKYFWDFGHPVSGLSRERNNSGDLVTSGGSGFGVMAIVTGIHRNFIGRTEGLERIQKMTNFLKNTAKRYHGAYPHWLNGATGATIPFSTKDDGADLVETSYLVMGLLTARQYFNGANQAETALRDSINALVDEVEWNWFRKNNENLLYWHWSPNFGWDMNLPIRGWNECLITYVLAASSNKYGIPKSVYDNGWAQNGNMRNNNQYYGYTLPVGSAFGGPLFFSHYSFLGINPNGLTDAYANYKDQVTNHTKINYEYCKANPKQFYGYSASCWGLTASDIPGGYAASSPTNDIGVIAPTAALSSFPYTPTESMAALKFFYYTLGDKLFKEYGFVDAFALKNPWFANSFLAIDQGPILIMIENHRSGLLWNLFTSCSEVKTGMKGLGFTAPWLN